MRLVFHLTLLQTRNRPLILIGHSFGGLLIEQVGYIF